MAKVFLKEYDVDIFEMYPELLLVEEFDSLVEKEGRKKASNILKAIYFIWDPKSNLKNSGMSHAEVVKDINKNLLKNPRFSWDSKRQVRLRKEFTKVTMDANERQLLRLDEEIEGLDGLIKKMAWTEDNASKKTTLIDKYHSLISKADIFRDKVSETKNELGLGYGGYQKSMIEKLGSRNGT